jgi:hypothetical protein
MIGWVDELDDKEIGCIGGMVDKLVGSANWIINKWFVQWIG